MNGKEVRVSMSLLVGDIENMVQFYRDILGFQTQWNGGPFADFKTASGELSLFMYSREEFVKAIAEEYMPPNGIIKRLKSHFGYLNMQMLIWNMSVYQNST